MGIVEGNQTITDKRQAGRNSAGRRRLVELLPLLLLLVLQCALLLLLLVRRAARVVVVAPDARRRQRGRGRGRRWRRRRGHSVFGHSCLFFSQLCGSAYTPYALLPTLPSDAETVRIDDDVIYLSSDGTGVPDTMIELCLNSNGADRHHNC